MSATPHLIEQRSTPWPKGAGPVLLFIAIVALYAPSLGNDFIYDDYEGILRKPTLSTPGEFAAVFTERTWSNLPYYRPVPDLTYRIQKSLHGQNPVPYHMANIVGMALCAVLLYGLLRSPVLAVRPMPAMLGAALFGVHPVASSCVYPIHSGRESMMPTILLLAAMYALLRPGRGWYALSIVLLAAALLSKEQAAVIPAMFVLADLLGLSAGASGRRLGGWVVRYLPIVIVVAAYFLVRMLLFGSALGQHQQVTLFDHLAGPVYSLWFNLQITFAPFFRLHYEPPMHVWASPAHLGVVAAVVALIGGWGYACRAKLRPLRRVLLFWLGWYLLALMPTANILYQEARFTERSLVMTLPAIIGSVALLVSVVWDRPAVRRLITAAAACLIVVCAAISVHRARYFENNVAFAEQWLRTNPGSATVRLNAGDLYSQVKRHDKAIECYRRGLEINPNSADGHMKLGAALHGRGQIDEALAHYTEALRLKPDFAEAHSNMGVILLGQRRVDEALAHHGEAVKLKPDFAQAHHNLGLALQAKGRIDEAMAHYAEAIRLEPQLDRAHKKLAEVLSQRGRFGEAAAHHAEALRLAPDNVAYLNDIAWFLATCPDASHRDGRRAVELAQRAARPTPVNDAVLLDTLAAAYAEAGRFDEAIATARKAVHLARTGKRDALADEIKSRLSLYRKRHPYRQP